MIRATAVREAAGSPGYPPRGVTLDQCRPPCRRGGIGQAGAAEQVRGTAAPSTGDNADVHTVSCASAGNSSGRVQLFAVGEVSGRWGAAEEVPGTAALNKGRVGEVSSVLCGSAASCAAGGDYSGSSGSVQAFVVDKT